jgi:type IV secretory pathway VirB2 component (pilin)
MVSQCREAADGPAEVLQAVAEELQGALAEFVAVLKWYLSLMVPTL